MKLMLNKYGHNEIMHVKFIEVSSVIAELLPFGRLNFNDFSILSHYKVNNGWNFMKLILNICDHNDVMRVKFYCDVISHSRVIAL